MGMARVDAFYFALSSTTATGYGDFTPEGRLPVLATIPFLWTACGAFAAMLEACHNYAKLSMVQKTPLVRVIDQLLLQPTPWDATAGGDHHMHAARAEPGAGLSEAEFMLACLCGHGLVDVPTLVALRKQFATLAQIAERHDVGGRQTAGGEDGGGEGGGGGGGERAPAPLPSSAMPMQVKPMPKVIDVRAVFAINLAEGRILQRPAATPVGATEEVPMREGETFMSMPNALIDLTAEDGGFTEWRDHIWLKELKEERAKLAAMDGVALMAADAATVPVAAGRDGAAVGGLVQTPLGKLQVGAHEMV